MNLSDPIAAVEIGTSRTVVAIAESKAPGRISVVAVGEAQSSGVKKSQVADIAKAGITVAGVLKSLENDHGYSIVRAALAVTGPHIRVKRLSTQWQIDRTVTENDLVQIYNRSLDTGLEEGRTLLDVSELGYGLDGMEGIASPKGMSGRLLKLHTLLVHGSGARIDDARAAASSAKLDISEAYFAGRCAAEAVLSAEDKAAGTLLVDLGGGSTSYVAFAEGREVHAGAIAVGGDHVTNDIRTAFSLSKTRAETAKRSASAVFSPDRTGRVEIPASMMSEETVSVSMRALDTVVNARFCELFSIVREEIESAGVLHALSGGVVLTGGGAMMQGVAPLAQSVFGIPARTGTLLPGIEGLEKDPFPARCATIAGALLFEQRNEEEQSVFDPIANLWKKFFPGGK